MGRATMSHYVTFIAKLQQSLNTFQTKVFN